MTQRWLRGTLEGHYVGRPAGSAMSSGHGTAQRYRLKIFRAFVRDITVFDPPDGGPAETPASDATLAPDATLVPDATLASDATEASEDTPSVPPLPVALPDGCFFQSQIADVRFFWRSA